MTDDWKLGYKRSLLDAFVRSACPVSPEAGIYGWIHDDWREVLDHLRACGLAYDVCPMPQDVSWDEFTDTFADPGVSAQHGLDALVTCQCGRVRGVNLRLTKSFSELLTAVLRED